MKEVTLCFHNRGLRSFIEVDLCQECPRNDDKGCCGFYSPVFYAADFAYLLINNPELIKYILSMSNLTVLDASVTVNKVIEGDGYRCRFHSREKGCTLEQEHRESVCRHFVCPGVKWAENPALDNWKTFFNRLAGYEIELNNKLSKALKEKGLTLRDKNKQDEFFYTLLRLYELETRILPDFLKEYPRDEDAKLFCTLKYGENWPL